MVRTIKYELIYLDYNATTPVDKEVKKAMVDSLPIFGNPSSSHRAGMVARAIVEQARCEVARLVGCNHEEIIFTAGGTESNNLAIIGTAYKYQRGHIITSVIEHPSVLNPLKWLSSRGFDITFLLVDSDGRVSPDELRKAIRKDTIMITIMHSNNETGVLQPISEIGRIAREHDIPFHTDAAQSIGKMEINVGDLMVDILTIVSHKFYGPKGIGALYIKDLGKKKISELSDLANPVSHIPYPIMFGAGHERGIRPGTENITGIAGLGKACEIACPDVPERYEYTYKLRERLFNLIRNHIDVRLNGHETLRLPNTLNISIKGIIGDEMVEAMKDRMAFSTGSACHSGMRMPSPVLKAMGLSDSDALSSIRLSAGKDNTFNEIEEAAEIIVQYVKNLP